MPEVRQYIAVDLGAESGRVMLGAVDQQTMSLTEAHRFGNGPIKQGNSIRWDFTNLMKEIKTGIAAAVKQSNGPIAGIGVDSWGVDFGLLDADGSLVGTPYHYRDSRTDGMMDKAFKLMDKRSVYDNTGIQFMQLNTLYQLLALRLANDPTLTRAKSLTLIADLVAYHLCGKCFCEYSLASTSQLMDMRTGKWSKAIFEKLSLPLNIMPEIVAPGTVVGKLTKKVAAELGCEPIDVIAVGSHDTASAVAGVPAAGGKNWAYLSSGTWSLMGLEVPNAIINDKTFEYQFTNEGGIGNTIRLLKNIMGLWLVQECRRQWQREGTDLSYTEITKMAQQAKPFAGFIDLDYHDFLAPGDMPAKINKYLKETHQNTIDDKGQLVRMILENLAFRYRWVIEKLEDIQGKKVDVLHIVGGGIQNELLCQFAANATGKEVVAGPIEATASGNIITQALAVGQIESLNKGRQIIANSYKLKRYSPQQKDLWAEKYKTHNANQK
jgi:sugar (pentulose or hexulose) kinase